MSTPPDGTSGLHHSVQRSGKLVADKDTHPLGKCTTLSG